MSVATISFKLIVAMMIMMSVKLALTESTANHNEIGSQFDMVNSDEANQLDRKVFSFLHTNKITQCLDFFSNRLSLNPKDTRINRRKVKRNRKA